MSLLERNEIYLSKVFGRIRNKTQLFNALADDHFHTRLMHSLEVEQISLIISEKLSKHGIKLNEKLISNIALLHDIGHTPFGHIGERTLHTICSGKASAELNLPNFKELNVECGFKHNINSALLYAENFPFSKKSKSVADGIIMHSKLYYSGEEKLDYGIGYTLQRFKYKINYKQPTPLTDEATIVYFADEIAQVASDWVDLNYAKVNIDSIKNLSFFKTAIKLTNNIRNQSVILIDNLSNSFVKAFVKYKNHNIIKKSSIGKWLNKFSDVRAKIIKTEPLLKEYDSQKETEIKILFKYYFYYPEQAGNDLLDDFMKRAMYLSYSYGKFAKIVRSANSSLEFLSIFKKEVLEYKGDKYLSDRKRLYKVFIRSVAIYISKMTDSYADHKYTKICEFYKNQLLTNEIKPL